MGLNPTIATNLVMKIIIEEIESCSKCHDRETCVPMIGSIYIDNLNAEMPLIAPKCPLPSIENSDSKMYMREIDSCFECPYRKTSLNACLLVNEDRFRDWIAVLMSKQVMDEFNNKTNYNSEIYPGCPLPDAGMNNGQHLQL